MSLETIRYYRWLILMETALQAISLEDLKWASAQPFNSLASKNIFLAEIKRRMKLKNQP